MAKQFLKWMANVAAAFIAYPAVALYFVTIAGSSKGSGSFESWSQTFSLLPGVGGMYIRRAFFRATLKHCAADCCVSFGTVLSHATASIGRGVYIGPFCVLGDVTLEDDVLLGSNVSVTNGNRQHGIERLDIPIREQTGVWPHVTIGRDSWIGDRAVVMANVGKHCVIGAGSVVTKPIPDYAIAYGVPAKVVRFRTQNCATHSSSELGVSSPRNPMENSAGSPA